jgi:hypothetical protein
MSVRNVSALHKCATSMRYVSALSQCAKSVRYVSKRDEPLNSVGTRGITLLICISSILQNFFILFSLCKYSMDKCTCLDYLTLILSSIIIQWTIPLRCLTPLFLKPAEGCKGAGNPR